MTYTLGKSGQKIDLPEIEAQPACGFDPVIVNHYFTGTTVPNKEGVTLESLLSFDPDDKQITVIKQSNLELIGETVIA